MASGPVCLGCVAQDMTTTRKGIRVYACFISPDTLERSVFLQGIDYLMMNSAVVW